MSSRFIKDVQPLNSTSREVTTAVLDADSEIDESVEVATPVVRHYNPDPQFWRPNDEDHKVFREIDRAAENKLVEQYQRTRDPAVMAELYAMRRPTLWVWARNFKYLSDSEQDLFAELKPVWMKALELGLEKIKEKIEGQNA